MRSPRESLDELIARQGPVRFDVALELMLYGPGGFFESGAGAGRRADFLTSPEIGPLFGAVVARAVDAEWHRLGTPDPFVVVEGGAGRGTLARAVLGAQPACLAALRYVCVERSSVLREAAAASLPTEPPSNVFGAVPNDDDEPAGVAGSGPVVVVLDELPRVRITGMVIANELLDNVPFRLLERTGSGWDEVFAGDGGEVLVAAPEGLAEEASLLVPAAPVGARIPLQHDAAEWLRAARAVLDRGRVVIVDYADTTPSMAVRPWREWLRTYRGHQRGGGPLDDPGLQDVTCEVATDQLARVRVPDLDRAQHEWLGAHGIDQLVDGAKATWHERSHLGDLEAMKARSRVGEADALRDTAGLGSFRVLEWLID
jgi:SAM-dependent MidA family methyltransferase